MNSQSERVKSIKEIYSVYQDDLVRKIEGCGGKKPPWVFEEHHKLAQLFSEAFSLGSSPAWAKGRYAGMDMQTNLPPDLEYATVKGMHIFKRYWGCVDRLPGMSYPTRWCRVVDDKESVNRVGLESPIPYCSAVTAEINLDGTPPADPWDTRKKLLQDEYRDPEKLIDVLTNELGLIASWLPDWSWCYPGKKGVLLVVSHNTLQLRDKIEVNRRQDWRQPREGLDTSV